MEHAVPWRKNKIFLLEHMFISLFTNSCVSWTVPMHNDTKNQPEHTHTHKKKKKKGSQCFRRESEINCFQPMTKLCELLGTYICFCFNEYNTHKIPQLLAHGLCQLTVLMLTYLININNKNINYNVYGKMQWTGTRPPMLKLMQTWEFWWRPVKVEKLIIWRLC